MWYEQSRQARASEWANERTNKQQQHAWLEASLRPNTVNTLIQENEKLKVSIRHDLPSETLYIQPEYRVFFFYTISKLKKIPATMNSIHSLLVLMSERICFSRFVVSWLEIKLLNYFSSYFLFCMPKKKKANQISALVIQSVFFSFMNRQVN